MASVAWRWADLDEENFTTLVDNYMHWCERNSSPGSPAASVNDNLILFRTEFGVVTLTGQVDPAQPQSSEALETYLAEVTANVPNGMKTTQDDAPWQYTTLHAPEMADALGHTGDATAFEDQRRVLAIRVGRITNQDDGRALDQ
jgi:aclacinomycin oxidase